MIAPNNMGCIIMTSSVRVSSDFVEEAKIYSKIAQRAVTGQIEHWAKICVAGTH